MTIYTKAGDKGETGLPGKRRVPKTDQLFEVLGCLDQTNASIGIVLTYIKDTALAKQLLQIQRLFLEIGSCLASVEPEKAVFLKTLPAETLALEKQIDKWDKILPELKNFILPGGSPAGAQLHFVRTMMRQAERNYHRLEPEQKIVEISIYLNRLSDYFFQVARFCNFTDNQTEEIWIQKK